MKGAGEVGKDDPLSKQWPIETECVETAVAGGALGGGGGSYRRK